MALKSYIQYFIITCFIYFLAKKVNKVDHEAISLSVQLSLCKLFTKHA